MDLATQHMVRERADNRCEYCHIPQDDLPYVRFHIEHIRPKKHGGGDDLSNLALACPQCNLHKSANLSGVDPKTDQVIELFDPREQSWEEHFSIEDGEVLGLTPMGRVTVVVCNMNTPDRVQVRRENAL